MSRIFGLFRPNRGAHPDDSRIVDTALRTFAGQRVAVNSSGAAHLGRISFDNADLRGGVARAGGWLVALDGCFFNAGQFASGAIDHAALLARMLANDGAEAALAKLEGDFAAIAYDANNDRLLLMRDRLGVKPLYWARFSGAVACSSQPRALLTVPGISSEINSGFAARFAGLHYRAIDNIPDESPFATIRQVPAGTFVEISADFRCATRRYWSLGPLPDFSEPEDVLAQRYRSLLLDAVAKRLRVSENPGFTLSGGLDSSSVLCGAVEITKRSQHAFSSVYRDPAFDERHQIKDAIKDKVALWSAIEIPEDIALFDHVRKLVGMHDEPVATATWLSHDFVAAHAKTEGVTALFGGLGGDELNAGEYEYFPFFFADLKQDNRLAELDAEIAAWSRLHDHPIFKKNANVARDMIARVTDPSSPGRCLPDERRLRRYLKAVNPDFFDISEFRPVMDGPFDSYLKNRTSQDLLRETLPCCLRAEDRQCTAAGLQHFDPFLDHHLVEFMYRIPGTMKIRNGVTKQLLRAAMQGILPEATRTRVAKVGWNAPAHVWFTGRNLNDLRDLIASRAFVERGIYNVPEVDRLLDEHVEIVNSGAIQENHMMFFWQLVNLELWIEAIPEWRQNGKPRQPIRSNSAELLG